MINILYYNNIILMERVIQQIEKYKKTYSNINLCIFEFMFDFTINILDYFYDNNVFIKIINGLLERHTITINYIVKTAVNNIHISVYVVKNFLIIKIFVHEWVNLTFIDDEKKKLINDFKKLMKTLIKDNNYFIYMNVYNNLIKKNIFIKTIIRILTKYTFTLYLDFLNNRYEPTNKKQYIKSCNNNYIINYDCRNSFIKYRNYISNNENIINSDYDDFLLHNDYYNITVNHNNKYNFYYNKILYLFISYIIR